MKRAFTLIEAVILTATVLVFAAILYPIFIRFDTPRKSNSCQANLKQLGLGFMQYTRDYDEKFPPARVTSSIGWANVLQPYLKTWQIFQCPAVQTSSAPPIDYFYNRRLARLSMGTANTLAQTILFGDGQNDAPTWTSITSLPRAWKQIPESPARRHLDGANYCFTDGHVKLFKPAHISATSPTSKSQPTFAVR